VLSPTIFINRHWFLYAAESVESATYYNGTGTPYDYAAVAHQLLQAFIGYSGSTKSLNWLIKAGRLNSTFGLAPSKYDDATMPFVLPPPTYLSAVPIRPDQVPCGANELLKQRAGQDLDFSCGGVDSDSYGISPVTLYGIPAIELQVARGSLDARIQITNSSPSNPLSLLSSSQRVQMTGGGGVRLPAGFHVGFSAFKGSYLDREVSPALASGMSWTNAEATGRGIDAQWLSGPWSADGEWQRFTFEVPGFLKSPSVIATYVQIKRVLSPRLFAATRVSGESFGSITDANAHSIARFQPTRTQAEIGLGYRLNPHQLVKLSAGLSTFSSPVPGSWKYLASIEWVTSFTPFSKTLH
jgi:hypothetical protein